MPSVLDNQCKLGWKTFSTRVYNLLFFYQDIRTIAVIAYLPLHL